MKKGDLFYIASALERADEVKALALQLEAFGMIWNYNWTIHGSVQNESTARIAEVAAAEINGVVTADVVIVLLPGGRGTHAELGAAVAVAYTVAAAAEKLPMLLATPPEIIVVGDQKDASGRECCFYYHPAVTRLPDIAALLIKLNEQFSYGYIHPFNCDCAICTTLRAEKP